MTDRDYSDINLFDPHNLIYLTAVVYRDKTGVEWTRKDILDLPTVHGDPDLANQTIEQWRANDEEYN